jgi:hypothetical protein
MLQPTQQPNEVYTLKLVTGEEVIGYLVGDAKEGITLRKPVVPVQMDEGFGLAPYLMTSDYLHSGNGELNFKPSAIVTSGLTGTGFANMYMRQVSGIDMSSGNTSGLIMT